MTPTTWPEVAHLYIGCKVQYKGILNGKEIKKEREENKQDPFYISKVKEVVGWKVGHLKKVEKYKNGTTIFRVGSKSGGLKGFWNNSTEWKPFLRPLSSMTEEEMEECGNLDYDFRGDNSGLGLNEWRWEDFETLLTSNQFLWLLSRHFDLFDLIPSAQAIGATTSPNQTAPEGDTQP